MMKNRIVDRGSWIEAGFGARHAAGLTRSSILNPVKTTDEATSHLTKAASCQVIGYSHSTRLPKDSNQVAGYVSSKGFSLVSAIFLLVVLAGLGAAMMTFFTAQQQSSAQDVLGSRAYQAARAGIEWGAYQALQGVPPCAAFPAVTTTSLAAGTLLGTLNGFTVTVTCTFTLHNDTGVAGGVVTVYNLTSTATQGAAGQPDFVERQMNVTLKTP